MASMRLTLALCLGLAALASGCGGEPTAQPVSLEGELRTYYQLTILTERGRGEAQYYVLALASGEERRLLFDTAPEVEPNTRVRVFGVDRGDAIQVDRLEVLGLRLGPFSGP
jgi:hypothetical protein